MNWITSKTLWGSILAAFGQVAPLIDAGLFGPKVQGITTGIGIILGAVGVRSAISKNGAGK